MEAIRHTAGRDWAREVIRLVQSAKTAGLSGIILGLRRALDAEVGLFDLAGNALALAPERTIWNYAEVLAGREQRPGSARDALAVRAVDVDGEVVALLAARHDGGGSELMEVAAGLAAIELARLRARSEGRRELAAQVIDDVISNRLSERDAASRLRDLALDVTRPHRVLLGRAPRSQRRVQSVPWNIHALMSNTSEPFLRVVHSNDLLMIIPDDGMTELIAQNLLLHLEESGVGASVGVSLAHSGAAGLRAGYFEALTAALEGPGVRSPTVIDLPRLLVTMSATVPSSEIASSTLAPLIEYDRLHSGELVRTLRTYLECDRVSSVATDRLFIHRNTLRYRLRQIHELLGLDLDATRNIANLWTSLLAREEGLEEANGGRHPEAPPIGRVTSMRT